MQGAPIFRYNRERQRLVEATIDRVCAAAHDALHLLNDAAYHETRRLDGTRRPKDLERLERWRALARRLGKMSDAERRRHVRGVATEYANDIAGHFDPRVFKFSTRLIPMLVTSLLSPRDLPGLIGDPAKLFSLDALADKVSIQGNHQKLLALAELGTLVFVPTHSSNMDSIVFGLALERVGLPPATYGAGKNLFTNPVLSFFMENLGAYRVDRRLRHRLYKDCLKAYSTVLVEHGYHSLFFPGGTRSRSGAVENKLKLGLVGTGIEAYTHSLLQGREQRVFFVPSTINYLITLEAETLINDFLSASGKARFIIDDDESTRVGRIAAFARKLLTMKGSVVVRFGEALDPFGLEVDANGNSRDYRGRQVEPASYVSNLEGEVNDDPGRNTQYTRELGREMAAAYQRHTVIMSTHLVASACFSRLKEVAPSSDIFTVLRVREQIIERDALAQTVLALRDKLQILEQEDKVVLADEVRNCSGADILSQAMAAFDGYHTHPVIESLDRGVALRDARLLFYYQNRIASLDALRPVNKSLAGANA